MIGRNAISFLIVGVAVALVLGCSSDSSSSSPTGPTVMTPPESILGTFAFPDDTAGVYEFNFEPTPSGSALSASARHTASGKVRYASQDFTAAGYFENSDGSISITAELSGVGDFVVAGSYTEEDGFSGTIQYFGPDGTLLAEGTATGAAGSDGGGTTVLYTGTYGGDSWGVWNGALSGTVFVGTYSGDGDSGPLYMTRSGDKLTMNQTYDGGTDVAEGTISSDGSTITGWWEFTATDEGGSVVDRGTWTGAKVEGDYDPHLPSSDDDPAFLANVISQTIENGITGWDEAYEHSENEGIQFTGESGYVSADGPGIGASAVQLIYTTYWFNQYRDTQTGMMLNGYVYIVPDAGGADAVDMIIDNVDEGSSGTLDTSAGMEVTFPGDPIPASYLFVDARIDWDSGSLSAFNESSPVWTLSPNNTYGDIDDIDVVSDMEAIFFGN